MPAVDSPLLKLDSAELEFITQLVLYSGSLKDLAAHYGVSYPTIRIRLDRIITRLQAVIDGRPSDPMKNLLADLIARGDLTTAAAREIRTLWRERQDNDQSIK